MPFALKRFANPEAHAWIYTHHINWNDKVAADGQIL
jgi:FAD-dependent urate hydroxylase